MTGVLLILMMLPSLLMVAFSLSSLAIGLVISSCLILSLLIVQQKPIFIGKAYVWLVATGVLWVFLNPYSLSNSVHEKQLFSMCAMLLCGCAITSLLRGRDEQFQTAIRQIFWILLAVGFLGWLDVFRPGAYGDLNRPLPPFSEPSHFALIYIPVACAFMIGCSTRLRFFVCIISLMLSVLLPNFTLLVGTLLLSFVVLSARQVVLFISLLLVFLGAVLTFDPVYLDYFTSRVASSENENISRLVYIQGWESMASALQFSNGLGVGYQNLGIEPPGNASAILETLTGGALNRSDGSFLAAKIIGEFGVFGMMVVMLLVILSVRSGFALRKAIKNGSVDRNSEIFSLCFTYTIILEFFVRGAGYFSPSFLVFMFFLPRAMRFLRGGKGRLMLHFRKRFQADESNIPCC